MTITPGCFCASAGAAYAARIARPSSVGKVMSVVIMFSPELPLPIRERQGRIASVNNDRKKLRGRGPCSLRQNPHLPAALRPAASPVKRTGEVRVGPSAPTRSNRDEVPHLSFSLGPGVTPAQGG